MAENVTPHATLLGQTLQLLPVACRALHARHGRWSGEITVSAARFAPVRALARLIGLPREVSATRFALVTEQLASGRTRWTREIGRQRISSHLWAQDGLLVESLGPVRVASRLNAGPEGMTQTVVSQHLFGVPIPPRAWAKVTAREWQDKGLYHFDISVSLPIAGRLVAYRGWLDTSRGG